MLLSTPNCYMSVTYFCFLSFRCDCVSATTRGVCVCVWLINCCTQNTQNQINVNQSEKCEWKNNIIVHVEHINSKKSTHGPDVDICITAFAYIVSEQLIIIINLFFDFIFVHMASAVQCCSGITRITIHILSNRNQFHFFGLGRQSVMPSNLAAHNVAQFIASCNYCAVIWRVAVSWMADINSTTHTSFP